MHWGSLINIQEKKQIGRNGAGAPNDGFLQNAQKSLIRLSRAFRSLEMHSKLRYKICIC